MAKKNKELIVQAVDEVNNEDKSPKKAYKENKNNDAKRLKKVELLEILVAMSEENEILKRRNEQLEHLLEMRATEPVNASIDTSNLINEIIESIGEIFHKDQKPTQPDITAKVREIYSQKLSNEETKEKQNQPGETTDKLSFEDVWSGRDEVEKEEDILKSKYLQYSNYSEYVKNN